MTFATVHAIRTNKQTKMCVIVKIMRQKNETIIINEEQRRSSEKRAEQGMDDGWMDGLDGMDFVRKVSTAMVRGKRRVSITLLRKRDGIVRSLWSFYTAVFAHNRIHITT